MNERTTGFEQDQQPLGTTLTDQRADHQGFPIDQPLETDTVDKKTDGVLGRVKEKLHGRADIVENIEEAIPSTEEVQKFGSQILTSVKDTVHTIREKTPEFMSRHRSKVALGIGAFTTARMISNNRNHKRTQMKMPITNRTLSKASSIPTEVKEFIHTKTA